MYFPGGNTELLIERLRNMRVGALLKNYDKVIVGNSAGALVLCKECIMKKGRKHRSTIILAGLRLVDFSVDVHYKSSKDKELFKLSDRREIYAITEKSALIFDNNHLTCIGEVYLFHGDRKTKLHETNP